jgi:hypothetical protein
MTSKPVRYRRCRKRGPCEYECACRQGSSVQELADNWSAFRRRAKRTRLIIAGKDDEAKKIATGIQKERLKKSSTTATLDK